MKTVTSLRYFCLTIFITGYLSCGSGSEGTSGVDKISYDAIESPDEPTNGITSFPTAEDLPECRKSRNGVMYWIIEIEQFALCYKGKYQFLKLDDPESDELQSIAGKDGEDGKDGANGADGTDGTNGNDGLNGEPGKNSFFRTKVYDSTDTFIGYRVDETEIGNVNAGEMVLLLTDGAVIKVDTASGEIVNSVSISSSLGSFDSETYCAFSSVDCSGTCILAGDTYLPFYNAVFAADANTFYIATGEEADNGAQTVNSVYSDGLCSAVGGVGITKSYSIVESYSFPLEITYPLQTPFQFSSIIPE